MLHGPNWFSHEKAQILRVQFSDRYFKENSAELQTHIILLVEELLRIAWLGACSFRMLMPLV